MRFAAAATRSTASCRLVRSFSPPGSHTSYYGTCYRMDAGAGAGAEPRCLAKRRGRNKSGEIAERRAEEGEGPACAIHLLNEEEAEGPEGVNHPCAGAMLI